MPGMAAIFAAYRSLKSCAQYGPLSTLKDDTNALTRHKFRKPLPVHRTSRPHGAIERRANTEVEKFRAPSHPTKFHPRFYDALATAMKELLGVTSKCLTSILRTSVAKTPPCRVDKISLAFLIWLKRSMAVEFSVSVRHIWRIGSNAWYFQCFNCLAVSFLFEITEDTLARWL